VTSLAARMYTYIIYVHGCLAMVFAKLLSINTGLQSSYSSLRVAIILFSDTEAPAKAVSTILANQKCP